MQKIIRVFLMTIMVMAAIALGISGIYMIVVILRHLYGDQAAGAIFMCLIIGAAIFELIWHMDGDDEPQE